MIKLYDQTWWRMNTNATEDLRESINLYFYSLSFYYFLFYFIFFFNFIIQRYILSHRIVRTYVVVKRFSNSFPRFNFLICLDSPVFKCIPMTLFSALKEKNRVRIDKMCTVLNHKGETDYIHARQSVGRKETFYVLMYTYNITRDSFFMEYLQIPRHPSGDLPFKLMNFIFFILHFTYMFIYSFYFFFF